MTFGERLLLIRRSKKLTQTKLAKMAGIENTSLCLYEHDRVEPRLFTAICLADALGVSLDELVGRE